MAGMISARPEVDWTASGWLFDWVLSNVADQITDLEFAGALRGIVSENLGFLSLADLSVDHQRAFGTVAIGLPNRAQATWREFEGRDAAINHLKALLPMLG